MRLVILLLFISVDLWGQVTVSGGVTIKGGVSVSNLGNLISSENTYCGPGDVPNFGSNDGPAALPQACTYTAISGTPSPGTVRTVNTNCADVSTGLAATITAAVAGDTIVIPASDTCTGQFTFPTKAGADINHWITVTTSAISDPNFPHEGTQATPCNINLTHIDGYPDFPCLSPAKRMPTLTFSTNNSTNITVTGAFYRFIGLEVTKNYGSSEGGQFINLQYSDHVILDRMLIHGDNWDVHAPQFNAHVGVQTRGTHQAIINSWIYDIDWNSADGYTIGGGTGDQSVEGPLKIYNNLLAGSSETFLFGGGSAVAWPADYEIRRNLSMKPLKWMVSFNGRQFPNYPNIKNLGEYKHGHRGLLEDNVFINNWEGQADQFGYAIVVIPKNQSAWNQNGFANTNGHNASCASDALGTACSVGTGQWGNYIVSMSRTSGVVTLNGATNGNWPFYVTGNKIVLQNIQSQVVSGTDLASFNGEWTMGCLPAGGTCTNGFSHPNVIYFSAPGPDFALTTLAPANTGLAQDYTSSGCAIPNHCVFTAPVVNFGSTKVDTVVDTEHITTVEDFGVQTGVTQRTCHAGTVPNAQIQDITIRYNYIAHSENIGINMQNSGDTCLDMSKGVSKFSIHDNLADDIQVGSWIVAPTSGHGGTGPIVNNAANLIPAPYNITMQHNTWAGLRGYFNTYFSQGAAEISDQFNVSHSGTTFQRISNVVTINFGDVSGDAILYNYAKVSGFGGGNTDINGTWALSANTQTSVTFTEGGSHADIPPGTSAAGVTVINWPPSYYANYIMKDNIFAGPIRVTNAGASLNSSVSAQFANNLCDVFGLGTCTWNYTNNVYATLPYATYATPSGAYYASIPTVNPDTSATCSSALVTATGSSTCAVTNLSGVFTSWGNGLGNTSTNDYRVTANYKNAGTDGKDLGADITHINLVKSIVLPHFTYNPLTISTASLTACTNGVYCEQQLLISSGASGPNGFVMWHLISGSLPAGMSLSTFDNNLATDAKVNGAFKSGVTGSAGWLWGTPTTPGTYPMTFQAEDAAHQTATVNLSLVVN